MLVIVRALDPAGVQSLRLHGFDFLEELTPRKDQPLRVGIVSIDDRSLAQYGQWPWSRARVAQLVDKIAAGKPSVLGIDIIFAEPDRLRPDAYPNQILKFPPQSSTNSRSCQHMSRSSPTLSAESRRCLRWEAAMRLLAG